MSKALLGYLAKFDIACNFFDLVFVMSLCDEGIGRHRHQ